MELQHHAGDWLHLSAQTYCYLFPSVWPSLSGVTPRALGKVIKERSNQHLYKVSGGVLQPGGREAGENKFTWTGKKRRL